MPIENFSQPPKTYKLKNKKSKENNMFTLQSQFLSNKNNKISGDNIGGPLKPPIPLPLQ